MTAHYVCDDWQLKSHVLQTRAVYQSHTGAHLAGLLQDVVSKDLVLVTDNTAHKVVAAQMGKMSDALPAH